MRKVKQVHQAIRYGAIKVGQKLCTCVQQDFENKNTQTVIFSQKELKQYRINRFPLILT